MWQCAKCREKVEDIFDVCWNCGTSKDGVEDPHFRKVDDVPPEQVSESVVEAIEPRKDLDDPLFAPRPTARRLQERRSAVLNGGFGRFMAIVFVINAPLAILSAIVARVLRLGEGGIFLLKVSELALVSPLATAALAYATFCQLRGEPWTVGECLRLAVRQAGPVLLAALLFWPALLVGMALLILPGLFVLGAFALTLPALVIEEVGVLDAFRRSWSLTRDYRWEIVDQVASSAFLAGVVAYYVGVKLPWLVASLVFLAPMISIVAVGAALGVSYHDLRRFAEGYVEDDPARVFE